MWPVITCSSSSSGEDAGAGAGAERHREVEEEEEEVARGRQDSPAPLWIRTVAAHDATDPNRFQRIPRSPPRRELRREREGSL